eukprot:TRINITY_DN23110_c0_g1_i1.p1 TRINITY_DN23110_c0_g1~~TRINITY_DN23110_c0_g1_i1.p1  ORF type:complete len:359 (-),score=75.41 TRINITY_DN23110_c0_g1_i1:165-1241(-)
MRAPLYLFGILAALGAVAASGYISDASIELLHTNDGETYASSLTIDLTGRLAFLGTDDSPSSGAGLYMVNLSSFKLAKPRVTVTPSTGYLYSAFVDAANENVYFTGLVDPGTVVAANIKNFANPKVISFNGAGQSNFFYGFRSLVDTTYGYLLGDSKLIKFDLKSFEVVATLELPPVEAPAAYQTALPTSNGAYVYFATWNASRSLLVEVSLLDWAVTNQAYIDYANVYDGFIDCTGTFGYFTTTRWLNGGEDVGYAIKVRLSDLTVAAAYKFPKGETEIISGVMGPEGDYAYIGLQDAKVVQLLVSNMTRVASAQAPGLPNAIPIAAATAGRYVYFTVWGSPGTILMRLPVTTDNLI